MTTNPWSTGGVAARLRLLHQDDVKELEIKIQASENEQKAAFLLNQKAQSKAWALEKAGLRHKRLHQSIDISGSELGCNGACEANEDKEGWWHCGCTSHCFCSICRRTNECWMGVD